MENINKVEIRGTIGEVKKTELSGHYGVTLAIVTQYVYMDSNHNPVIETTWHRVVIWAGKSIPAERIVNLQKGDAIHLVGRLRQQEYIGKNGENKYFSEILVNKILD